MLFYKSMQKILAPLNNKQREAVETIKGPLLIIAGAGSGKTKTLVHRLAYLIDYAQVKPNNILAVTFTNKAAAEMKERTKKLLGKDLTSLPVMGTFHSVCVRLLRQEIDVLGYNKNFAIFDDQDSLRLLKKIIKDQDLDPKNISARSIAVLISRAKNELISATEYNRTAQEAIENITSKIYDQYQEELKLHNALDFDDLIMMVVTIFLNHPEILKKYQDIFKYILVDEYQDTNHAQYVLIKLLAQKNKNLCVVGDDSQSIYGWRGADMRNILNFEKDYPEAKVVLLEQNYRSTKHILQAANEIIKYNISQKEKNLWTENINGSKLTIKEAEDQLAEGEFIIKQILNIKDETKKVSEEIVYEPEDSIIDKILKSNTFKTYKKEKVISTEVKNNIKNTDFSRYVVLYRTNAQSRALEEAFLQYGVPYHIVGGIKFYERKEIKDIIAYLRALANPQDWVSLERIYNEPARGLGKTSWLKIEKIARKKNINFLALEKKDLNSLGEKAVNAFFTWQNIFIDLTKKINELTPTEIIQLTAEKSGIKASILDGSSEGENRWENIKELLTVTKKYNKLKGVDGLNSFLEEVCLISDQDDVDESAKAINLMTIHAAKGLEFPVVFVVGMEEGLFPHTRSLFNPEEMEEERRLCYVAITRAREKLYFVYASRRTIYGKEQVNAASRFLDDLPKDIVQNL